MIRSLKKQNGNASVELALSMPVLIALSVAALGIFLLSVKTFYVADSAHRYARAMEIETAMMDVNSSDSERVYGDVQEVSRCSEVPMSDLIKGIVGKTICHRAKIVPALPQYYRQARDEKTDSSYACVAPEGGVCL